MNFLVQPSDSYFIDEKTEAPCPHEYSASDVIQVPWNQSSGSVLGAGRRASMPFGSQANAMQMSVQRSPVRSLGSLGFPLPELLVLTYLGKSLRFLMCVRR